MNTPKIRFKGFTDDWEQRKVGEVTKELLDYDNFSSGLPLLTSSRSGLMYQSEYRGNATTENENTLFSVVPLNACTYRHMSDDSTFHLNINTLEKGLVSKEYPVFQENESNLKFIVQYINSSNSFTKFCTEQKKGGTRTRLYYKTLCEYKLMMPSIKEQNKTANFFDTLDHLITLHQRKCDETKQLKKFMLQKMFPKNGEKNPEIRFKGFTDDWEQRKLGDVTQEFKSGTSLKAEEIDIVGDYPVYGGNGLRGYTSRYNHDDEYALIGRQGALCGNMNYSVGKAYFTEHAVVVKADDNNDTMFLYYLLDTMNLGQYSDQSAQPGLAVNKLVKLENLFPTKVEQQRIGWYFSDLDNLITLHQRKCEKLKELKKFMLQNMFV